MINKNSKDKKIAPESDAKSNLTVGSEAEDIEAQKEQKESGKTKRFFAALLTGVEWFFVSLFAAFGIFVIGVLIAAAAVYGNYAKNFDISKTKNNSTQNIFYDSKGTVIYESYGTKSTDPVKLSELSNDVVNATLAAEDAGFYHHGAIDPKGLARAAIENIKSSDKSGLSRVTDLFNESDYTQGGSTITQQLVKNLYLTNERSFDRKMKEIVYASELEKKWSKDKILEEYLNNVYYGEQALGIKNASLAYFGKPLNQLDLAEVTMLVGLPASPTKLDPISGDFNAAKQRQEYVLTQMVNLNEISLDKAKEAANEPLYFNQNPVGADLVLKHPFFVDLVKKELNNTVGQDVVNRGGLTVYTTLNPKNQDVAEAQAQVYMKKFASLKVTSTAIVALDNKNGTVSALVGGANWDVSKINMALSPRQPGSSFKPIMYTAAFTNGFTAATRLVDKVVNFGGTPPYIPHNYSGRYFGNITAHYAIDNSLNVPAVEMTKLVGVDKVIQTAKLFGITSINKDPSSYGLSIGLGSAEVSPWEMTNAYAVFANGGQKVNFSGIDHVVDASGNQIYTHQRYGATAFDTRVAYIMTNILSDNKARSLVFGSYNPLTLPDRKVAAKTGTTDSFDDCWTIGYTPQYTVGVWIGNNDRTPMSSVPAAEGAAYEWQDVMKGIHQGLAPEDFTKPEGLSTAIVNAFTGLPASSVGGSNIQEFFLPGTEPKLGQDFSYLKQF